MLLLKICLSFFLLFCFQFQSSLFSLSPFSLLQQINQNKRKHPLETKSPLSVPNKRKKRGKQRRTNTSATSLNESLNQDMEDDFIPDEIINSQTKNKKETPIECHICKTKIKTYNSLTNHFKDNHPGQYPYKCDDCGYECMVLSNSYKHKKKIHPSEEDIRKYICSFCKNSFLYESELKNHEIIHTGIKDFKCSICVESYSANRKLKTHTKKLHTKKYSPCLFCSQVFNTLYNLQQHSKDMHPLENTICEHCGKKFAKTQSTRTHKQSCKMNKNMAENTFPCFFCEQSFNYPYTLQQHSKEMHPLEKIICEHCGKKFANTQITRRHKQSCKMNKKDKGKDSHSHKENLNQEISHLSTYFQENDPTRNNPPPYDTDFNQNFPPSLYTQGQEEAICAEIRKTLFPPSLYTQSQKEAICAEIRNTLVPPSLYTQSQEEGICAEIRKTLFPPSVEKYDLPNSLELDNFLNGIAQDSRLKSQA